MKNKKVQDHIVHVSGGLECLRAAGFDDHGDVLVLDGSNLIAQVAILWLACLFLVR